MELTANIHLEDGSYWADVPELPGCFAAGDTLDELVNSLREGMEGTWMTRTARQTLPAPPCGSRPQF